jgi:hypothetical protein
LSDTSGIALAISVVDLEPSAFSEFASFCDSKLWEAFGGRSPSNGEAMARGTENIANFFGSCDFFERFMGNVKLHTATLIIP